MQSDDDLTRQIQSIERAGSGRSRIAWAAVALLCVAAAAFCVWWFVLPPSFSAYASSTVRIEGLADEPVDLSIAELGELECQRISAKGTNVVGSSVSIDGYGPTLDALLAAYGHERSDFVKVRIRCRDSYKVVLLKKHLEEFEDIYLAIADGHGPLRSQSQPLRIIVPGSDSNMWAYAISSIEFLETDPGVELDSTSKPQGGGSA